jgi:hypothetical protein
MLANVTLLSFGRKGYAFAAANLIASLRHYGYGGEINLWADTRCRSVLPSWVQPLASVKELPAHIGTDPCAIKLALPTLIDGPSLYLDVDAVALKDITPWVEALEQDGRPYITCVKGSGKHGDKIEYFAWASTATAKAKHALSDDAVYYGIQSSWAFMRPGDFLSKFHATATAIHAEWNLADLRFKWGSTMPDELFYSLACTVSDYNPAWEGEPMFWGKGFETLPQIRDKHYILSLWGSGKNKGAVPPRHVEKYDAIMRSVMSGRQMSHELKSALIREDKYVDHKKH